MSEEAARESLAKLKAEVGPSDAKPHQGGYLTQDEYATKLFYWAGEEHDGDEIEGMISALANCSWAKSPQRELAVAGTVLAFVELYADKESGWRSAYPKLFARVREAMRSPQSHGGWNDFHIAQWFVLRRARRDEGVEIIDKLLDRIADGGEVGYEARRAMQTCAVQCKPFEVALERAKRERLARMVIQ